MGPGLHGAVGQRPGLVRHDERLVVPEDVAEPLALRTGAQRVVEREEQRPRPREPHAALRAAELAAHRDHAPADQVHVGVPVSLRERRLQRVGDPAPRVGSDDDAIEHHGERLTVQFRRKHRRPAGGIRQVEHDLARLHARESALEEGGEERGRVLGGRRRQREADQRARSRMVADQRVGHLLGRIAPRLGATLRAVDASDPGEEQPEVVLELGGRAHRRAGGAHGVLLLDGDGRPDVLDAVHVGAVQPLEEHPGIGGERLDVAPLPLREQGVEGQRRLPGTGDPGDHRDPVVGDGDRHVLEVVLAGSFDPEPGGLGH